METIVLEELLKISDNIHSPEYLTHATRTPSRDDVPSLGGENLFEKVLNDFADDLQTALKTMADTTVVKADMTINVKGDASIMAKAGVYKVGDIIDKLEIPNSFAGVRVVPLFPGLTRRGSIRRVAFDAILHQHRYGGIFWLGSQYRYPDVCRTFEDTKLRHGLARRGVGSDVHRSR